MSLPPTSLPVRLQTDAGSAPVVSVDGVFGAEGLHLSHWPGNRTPPGLKRDLSTSIALEFARLPEAERARLAEGCEALAINHFDTDGLCALLALTDPHLALAHADLLEAAAGAGDLFRVPSLDGFRLDVAIKNIGHPASPVRSQFEDLEGRARDEARIHAGIQLVRLALTGGLETLAPLWSGEDARLAQDRAQLARALHDDLVHLDLSVWTGPAPLEVGRHALFGATEADRVLLLGEGTEGVTARFVLGTGSFFDLPGANPSARPDLEALAARLNGLEPAGRDVAWHHQDPRGASPELWFGTPGLGLYLEHATEHLAPSALDAATIKLTVIDAVRDAWHVPDDDDEADEGEDIFDV